jgi:hypothetical protein
MQFLESLRAHLEGQAAELQDSMSIQVELQVAKVARSMEVRPVSQLSPCTRASVSHRRVLEAPMSATAACT